MLHLKKFALAGLVSLVLTGCLTDDEGDDDNGNDDLSVKTVTLGAQANSAASSIDLDTWISYTANMAASHSTEIDLVFAVSTVGSSDSAALYSPIVAKNGVGGSGGFDFMASWPSANSTDIRRVTVSNWDEVDTQGDIAALYNAGSTPSPAGRVIVNAGTAVVAKTDEDLMVLIRVESVTHNTSGTVSLTGKAKW